MGKDLDFGKRPEVVGEVMDPPFYAGKIVASLLAMCGGLRTSTDCQVLDAKDLAIGGHPYACLVGGPGRPRATRTVPALFVR
nr:FAD-binding protein [Paraeggerthella hongkongensis]